MKNIYKYLFNPLSLVILYFLVILIFAFIYSSTSTGLNKNLNFTQGFYFSVVTITTLGYGDILPETEELMKVISLQAILGIFILGLFINSTWEYLERRDKIKHSESYVSYYSEGFLFILEQYKNVIKEVSESEELTSKFEFSNLKGIFKISRESRYGYNKSRIVVYYLVEDMFINELRHLRSDIDLELYPKIHNLISSYFLIHNKLNVGSPLLEFENHTLDGKAMKIVISEEVEKHKTVPEKSGLISGVINLYNGLIWKIACIKKIEEELKLISQ